MTAVGSAIAARARWRSYLLLARVSNLPTVWSNVAAGSVAGLATSDVTTLSLQRVAPFLAALSAFYVGGMFLNDAFDAPFDRRVRPERPIPRGEVGLAEAFGIGTALLAGALAMLSVAPAALPYGVVLALAIVCYDAWHKQNRIAPLVMGACRGLVYLVVAASGTVTSAAWVGAGIMVTYVAALTLVAKKAGASARWLVPAMIAGISIVDALFIVVVQPSAARLAALALLGFPATLILQRWVPGD